MNSITKYSVDAFCATLLCSALVACGGATDSAIAVDENFDTLAQPVLVPSFSAASASRSSTIRATVANDDTSPVADTLSAATVAGTSVVSDLTIENAAIMSDDVSSQSISYRFDIIDTSNADLSSDTLSVALEVAASGSFNDTYRIPLFDIRREDAAAARSAKTFTARSSVTDLPSNTYLARLVVNPNWQYTFDIVPPDHDHHQPFRYAVEHDYSNNMSNVFQLAVNNTIGCTEDNLEGNDSFSTATNIPAGGQIEAALCLDSADFYSVDLATGAAASLSLDYTASEEVPNHATSYVLFDSNANRIGEGIARQANDIVITADVAGTYYFALYGKRSSYRIIRTDGAGMANDFSDDQIFSGETFIGPASWLFGHISLSKLNFSENHLHNRVVSCGRITTQFNNEQPIGYVTPLHFAEVHQFRLLSDGTYLIDDELKTQWSVSNGDIVHSDWYVNDYPGYAEITASNRWRYWSSDGLAYTECTLE